MADDHYVSVNRANWNSRVPFHERGYQLDAYRADPTYLSNVVRFDLTRLGDVAGLAGVHLQCHIGTDTLSLARLGAHIPDSTSPRQHSTWPEGSPPTAGRASLTSKPSSSPRSKRSAERDSISCTRGLERSAGCPTSAAGPRS